MEVTRGQNRTSISVSAFPDGAVRERRRSRPRPGGEPFRRRWHWWTRVWVAFAGWLIATALRLIYPTLRLCYIDPADMFGRHARGERMIVAFWHDAIALMPLARATGLPVFAFGVAARPVRRLGSWDRLQVPWPFARVSIVVSEPLFLPRRAETGLADARAAIETALARVNATAAAAVGAL